MKRQAFTLIELLVVIAIIAILAAILFPVFAQAKNAAKGAASISNAKQIGTASFMYSGDYDDMNVVPVAWGSSGAPVSYGQNYSPWTWLQLPYMKTWDIFADPQAPPGLVWNFSFVQKGVEKVLEPHYGYNGSYLCPPTWNFTTGGYYPIAKSQTNGDDVANTVMFASHFSTSEDNFNAPSTIWGYFGSGGSGGSTSTVQVDPVMCGNELWPGTDGNYVTCFGNWGSGTTPGTGFSWSTYLKNKASAGAFSGGVSLRGANNGVVLWLDGHATKASPGSLSNGTNWTPTQTAPSIAINDRTKLKFTMKKS